MSPFCEILWYVYHYFMVCVFCMVLLIHGIYVPLLLFLAHSDTYFITHPPHQIISRLNYYPKCLPVPFWWSMSNKGFLLHWNCPSGNDCAKARERHWIGRTKTNRLTKRPWINAVRAKFGGWRKRKQQDIHDSSDGGSPATNHNNSKTDDGFSTNNIRM